MRLASPAIGLLLSLCARPAASANSAHSTISQPLPAPAPIFGGQTAMTCAWPTAVAVNGADALCTGTLVHPRVVMYAAHCGDGNKKILFGQDGNTPDKTISTDLCMINPGYSGVSDQEHDWAFCVLSQPITELPITPVVYGCEKDSVVDDAEAAIVGFGIEMDGGDAGVKHWALTPIRKVYSMSADVGGFGDPGICPGDSGGPAFIRHADGTWHVFGIASTLTGKCGGVGTHALAWHAVPWIESASGIDITPCHDQDGTWAPDFRCAGFFAAEPGAGVDDFQTWCPGTPTGPTSTSCGPAFDATPDDTPPTAQIVQPVAGSHPEDLFSTPIEVDAQDGDGWGVKLVRLEINGEAQPLVDDQPPFKFPNVKFPAGTWTIVAVAEDAAGLLGASAPVVLEVGSQAATDTGDSDPTAAPTTGDAPTTDADGSGAADDSGAAETAPTASGADASDTAAMDAAEDGCGCRGGPGAPGALALLLGLAARRRRASVRH